MSNYKGRQGARSPSNKAEAVSNHIVGKGWLTVNQISEQLEISVYDVGTAINTIMSSRKYQAQRDTSKKITKYRLISIDGVGKPDRAHKLMRLALFGERIT